MPYVPIEVPAGTPARVENLVRRLERQYLAEVHAMLRLPLPNYGLPHAAALPIAQVLLNAISGISGTLYPIKGKSGAQFKQLLESFYPWDLEPSGGPAPKAGAKLLYEIFRNPLTHNLGLHLFRSVPKVKIKRSNRPNGAGPSERSIARWETSAVRPRWSHSVLDRSDATVLFIEPLYWGTRVMLQRLLKDGAKMAVAERFLERKGYAT